MLPANMYPALGTALRSSHTFPQKHASWTQWHQRLAHLNFRDIKRLVYLSEGIDPVQANALEGKELPYEVCESCCMGKQSRKPSRVPRRQDPVRRATKPGQGTHADIAGGGKIFRTLGGARYVLALTDDATDMTETHLLKKKSDAFAVLKAYTAKMKAQGHRLEWFWSDNGDEFASTKAKDFMQSEGIKWQPTSPYSPHQNGVAERCFRTLFERACAILYDSGLFSKLWGEAIMTVTYLKNRSPTKALVSHGTPYEAW